MTMLTARLSQLRFMRITLSSLLPNTDPAVSAQLAVCKRIVEHLIAQDDAAALALRAQAMTTVSALLPALERTAGEDVQLRALCTASDGQDDPEDFERLLAAIARVQQRLSAQDSAEATALSLALVRLELDYRRGFEGAVDAQTAAPSAGVAPVLNVKEIDEGALTEFLRRSFPEEQAISIAASRFLGGGHSKFTVSLELEGTKRLPPQLILRADAGGNFGGSSVIGEYHLLEALYANGVCVPQPLALEETGRVFGSPFMLVVKQPGAAGPDPYILPAHNRALGTDVAAQLAAIHATPLQALGTRVGNAGRRASEQMLAWLDEGRAAWAPLGLPSAAFEAAFAWLRRHVAIVDRAPPALVHGDFGFHNMLVANDKVTAILDWEFTHVGNPAYDLGYFYAQAHSVCTWQTFTQAYTRAGGVMPDEKLLDYEILFAATRLGVMAQQAVASFVTGANTSVRGAAILAHNYYEKAVGRVGAALARVL